MDSFIESSKKIFDYLKVNFFYMKDPTSEEIYCYKVIKYLLSDENTKVVVSNERDQKGLISYDSEIMVLISHRQFIIIHNGEHRACFIDNSKLYNELVSMIEQRVEVDLKVIREKLEKSKEKFFSDILKIM